MDRPHRRQVHQLARDRPVNLFGALSLPGRTAHIAPHQYPPPGPNDPLVLDPKNSPSPHDRSQPLTDASKSTLQRSISHAACRESPNPARRLRVPSLQDRLRSLATIVRHRTWTTRWVGATSVAAQKPNHLRIRPNGPADPCRDRQLGLPSTDTPSTGMAAGPHSQDRSRTGREVLTLASHDLAHRCLTRYPVDGSR